MSSGASLPRSEARPSAAAAASTASGDEVIQAAPSIERLAEAAQRSKLRIRMADSDDDDNSDFAEDGADTEAGATATAASPSEETQPETSPPPDAEQRRTRAPHGPE